MEVTTRASIIGYLNRSPEADYLNLNVDVVGTSWIGAHRAHSSRQLAAIQRVEGAALTDFRFLAGIAHPNVTRLIALYYDDGAVYVSYEFVALDLFDICPLSEPEIAEVMSQVIAPTSWVHLIFKVKPKIKILSGVRKLMDSSVGFRIDSVRVTPSGTAKIVLDWSFESTVDSCIQEALRADTAANLNA
ncbi:hypothetical protein V8C37DRAFT_406614 [Trichoderma ceciliae]